MRFGQVQGRKANCRPHPRADGEDAKRRPARCHRGPAPDDPGLDHGQCASRQSSMLTGARFSSTAPPTSAPSKSATMCRYRTTVFAAVIYFSHARCRLSGRRIGKLVQCQCCPRNGNAEAGATFATGEGGAPLGRRRAPALQAICEARKPALPCDATAAGGVCAGARVMP